MSKIRKALKNEIAELQRVFDDAKKFMRANGNMNQWINGYPSDELLLNDIEADHFYVRENEDGKINGCFALIYGEDPTYGIIDGGSWLNNEPYAVIHRIANDGTEKKLLEEAVELGFENTDNIRIDTHRDNIPMQNALKKLGFKYCGIIYLANGDERLAYQKVK